MNTLSYKTKSANNASVVRKWHVIDATNLPLGRMASVVAPILRGKNKPYYTPHVDCGDYVVVINADRVRLTGLKWDQKEYIHYTGYPGGQRRVVAKELHAKKPYAVIEKAVKGMLPRTKLGKQMFKKLFVYAGESHPHDAQKPEPLNI